MLVFWGTDDPKIIHKEIPALVKYDGPKSLSTSYNRPSVEPGSLLVAMGSKRLAQLGEEALIPKNRTVAWCRYPRLFTAPEGGRIMVTYGPSAKEYSYSSYVHFRADVHLADRFMRTGTFSPVPGKYEYVSSFASAIKCISDEYQKTGKPVEVALDLETLGLNPYDPDAYIITIQLSYEVGHSMVIAFHSKAEADQALSEFNPLWLELSWLLDTPMVSLRGANFKYDLIWLAVKAQLECTNFKFDTMLVGSLLDENRHNSLNTHAKWYLPDLGGYDDKFDLEHDKSRMDLALEQDPAGFLTYAGGDTDACLQVSKLMKAELIQKPGLANFYINVLHPAARAYELVERTGLLVDVDYYMELEYEILEEMEMLSRRGLALLPHSLLYKHRKNLSLSKPSLIIDFLFTPAGLNLKPKKFTETTEAPATSADHMAMFINHPKAGPFVKILDAYADCSKTLSTYVLKRDKHGNPTSGFLQHLRIDRRYHPTHFLHNSGDGSGGTNTGRISVRDPAMQTVPKHTKWAKRLRRAFIAPPGMLVMGNDYSQGELKIAACLANETTMINAYRQGLDLHAVTGARMANLNFNDFLKLNDTKPDLFAMIRQRAKAGNFGFLYGMGAAGFVEYALNSYGVKVTEAEAEEARQAFFSAYPMLDPWHKEYKAYAFQHRIIHSPLGRIRHLPMIRSTFSEVSSKEERRAVNAPVQSTLSDMSLWATSILHQQGLMKTQPVVAMIHDQLVSYVPEDDWEASAVRMMGIMENLPFEKVGWKPQLQFTVDCEVGPNLGDLKKQSFKKAA